MLTLEQAQAILGAVGSDTPPTAEQLTQARAAFVTAAKAAKEKADKAALATMLSAINVAAQAIEAAKKLEAEAAAELDALTADIPELAADAADETPADEAPADTTPQTLSIADAIARLGLGGAATAADVVEVTDRPTQTLTINGEESSDASFRELGAAFAKSTKSMLRDGRTLLATIRTEYDNVLSGKAGDNTRLLDDIARQAADSAVVAAGGCCSLAEPIRDMPMLASLARPLADALPTIGASAGAVTLFPPVCLPQGGAQVWTCEQDAEVDADDPDTWKVCTEIECEEPDTITVEAIYRCLTIGNFQQRFAPERWEAILHAVLAQQARLAEQKLFSNIANSPYTVASTVTDTGSVYATFLATIIRVAAVIRQNQRYDNVRIKAAAPSWLLDAITADRLARAIQRGRTVEGASVDTLLAERNIDMIWTPDVNPIQTGATSAGALAAWPATASLVVWADGGVFRLDGGELNLGTEIRDHDLNRQNKVAAFGESFEAALVRSCDTRSIALPVTVCGSAPCQPAAAPGSTEDNPLFTFDTTPAGD